MDKTRNQKKIHKKLSFLLILCSLHNQTMVKQKKNASFCLSMFSPQPNKTKPTTSSLKFHFFFSHLCFPDNQTKLSQATKKCSISSQIQKQNRTTLPFSLPLCVISATKQNLTNNIFIKFSTFSHLCVPENQTKLSRAIKKNAALVPKIEKQNRKMLLFSLSLSVLSPQPNKT